MGFVLEPLLPLAPGVICGSGVPTAFTGMGLFLLPKGAPFELDWAHASAERTAEAKRAAAKYR